jgi:hypothetical protein
MRKLILLVCFLFGSALLVNGGFRAGYDNPRKDLNKEQKERSMRNTFHLHYINRTQSEDKCAPASACKEGLILPVWQPQVSLFLWTRSRQKFFIPQKQSLDEFFYRHVLEQPLHSYNAISSYGLSHLNDLSLPRSLDRGRQIYGSN